MQGTQAQRLQHPANQALIGLYQMIYSMMLSRLLLGSPVDGGAMYLAGRAASIFLTGAGRSTRLLVDKRRRNWNIVAFVTVLLAMLALNLLTVRPITMEHLWLLFAAVTAMTIRDIIGWRLVHLSVRRGAKGDRPFFFYYVLLQIVIVAVPVGLLLGTLNGTMAWMAAGGYVLASAMEIYQQLKSRAGIEQPLTDEAVGNLRDKLERTGSLTLFESTSALCVTALQMTMILMYTMLAFSARELLLCMAIALGATLISREVTEWMLRRRKKSTEPTNLVLAGLFLWGYGLIIVIQMFRKQDISMTNAYVSLAMTTAGSTLCMSCLGRLEGLVDAALTFAGIDRQGFMTIHAANLESAAMLGQMAALGVLTMMTAFIGNDLPPQMAFGDRFRLLQPLVLVPTLLTVVAAFLSAAKFPLSSRYERKLERFLHLRVEGGDNDALEKQLEDVVVAKRTRPVAIQIGKWIVRRFLHVRLVHAERIVTDDENPTVFLCNHGKWFGPLVCMVRMPVEVRPWVISEIAIDPQEFADYFYKYELADKKIIPARWKMPLARKLGELSVWGMDQLESIPVYRNKPAMLMRTMRLSVQAMEAGDNLLIFPENPNAVEENHGYELSGVGELFSGFAMLGQIYHSRTGKRCRFQPMFVNKLQRTMTFGEPITYDPDRDPAEERERISDLAYQAMLAMSQEERQPHRRLKAED